MSSQRKPRRQGSADPSGSGPVVGWRQRQFRPRRQFRQSAFEEKADGRAQLRRVVHSPIVVPLDEVEFVEEGVRSGRIASETVPMEEPKKRRSWWRRLMRKEQ